MRKINNLLLKNLKYNLRTYFRKWKYNFLKIAILSQKKYRKWLVTENIAIYHDPTYFFADFYVKYYPVDIQKPELFWKFLHSHNSGHFDFRKESLRYKLLPFLKSKKLHLFGHNFSSGFPQYMKEYCPKIWRTLDIYV